MTDSAAALRPSRRSLGWFGLIAIIVVALGVPAFLDQGVPLRRSFSERPLRVLEKARPQGVLIGDSMLESRIDLRTLKEIAGRRWVVLAQPGGSSAIWYLMMKNLVAVQSPPPKTVIILFRDRQLTLPAHRTEGSYRKTIERYMRDDEPLVEEVLHASDPQQKKGLPKLSHAMYPVQWRRDAWQEKVQSWALDFVASSGEYGAIRDAARDVFDLQNLRQDDGIDFESEEGGQRGLNPDEHEFGASVEGSFLPPILEIARQKNIQLIFYRVKRKPLAADVPAKEGLTYAAYLEALQGYLEKTGATLVDETHDPDVTLKYYGADDHVAPSMMKEYTRLFWSKMSPRVAPTEDPEPAR